MKSSLRVAVIGCGALGSFYAAKLYSHSKAELCYVVDPSVKKSSALAIKYPGATPEQDLERISADEIDAVVIATPATKHAEIAEYCLTNSWHALIEKPLAPSVAECKKIISVAEDRGLFVQVGHIERFNPLVPQLKEGVQGASFIEMTRGGPFSHRGTDVDIVSDLMIHDIDLMRYIVGDEITSLSASGASVFSDKIDIAESTLCFSSGLSVHLRASRVDIEPNRLVRVYRPDGVTVFDLRQRNFSEIDGVPSDDSSISVPIASQVVSNHASSDIDESCDPLMDQVDNFILGCLEGVPPRADLTDGIEAVRISDRILNEIMAKQAHVESSHGELLREAV